MSNQQQNIDAYSWHEALDRTMMVAEIFSSHVRLHPAIQQNISLKTKADRIATLIFELYQEVGNETPDDDND